MTNRNAVFQGSPTSRLWAAIPLAVVFTVAAPAGTLAADLTALHGRWDPERQNCANRGTVGDLSFALSDEGLLWYESSCRFRSVREVGVGSALLADMACDGEGQKWTVDLLLMPNNDGELLLYYDHGEGYLATRCEE